MYFQTHAGHAISLTFVLMLSIASTTQSAPSSHPSLSSPFFQRPIFVSICAQGAIFFRNRRVASTLGVPTSERVAAACRLREERVVMSNWRRGNEVRGTDFKIDRSGDRVMGTRTGREGMRTNRFPIRIRVVSHFNRTDWVVVCLARDLPLPVKECQLTSINNNFPTPLLSNINAAQDPTPPQPTTTTYPSLTFSIDSSPRYV